jgi:hypothetical protein
MENTLGYEILIEQNMKLSQLPTTVHIYSLAVHLSFCDHGKPHTYCTVCIHITPYVVSDLEFSMHEPA